MTGEKGWKNVKQESTQITFILPDGFICCVGGASPLPNAAQTKTVLTVCWRKGRVAEIKIHNN